MRRLVPVVLLFLSFAPAAGAWTWPVQGPVLETFSFDPAHPYAAGQRRGVAIGADTGAPVVAPAAGTVTFAGSVPTSGKTVTILTADGLAVTLTHLGSSAVARDAAIAEGSVVGAVGPSGTAELTVPYVHLGIRDASNDQGYLDPLSFLPVAAPPVAPPRPAPAPVAPPAAAPVAAAPVAAAPVAATPAPLPVAAPAAPVAGAAPAAPPVAGTAAAHAAAPVAAPVAGPAPAAPSSAPAGPASAPAPGSALPAVAMPPSLVVAARAAPGLSVVRPLLEPLVPARGGESSSGVSSSPGVPGAARAHAPAAGSSLSPPPVRRLEAERALHAPGPSRARELAPPRSHAAAALSGGSRSPVTSWQRLLAAALVALASLGAVGATAIRMISHRYPSSEGARADAAPAEDSRRAGLAVREWAAPHRACGGLRRAGRRLRALSPLEGQRRPDGERHRRARDAGDGVGRPEWGVAA
jgi:hypothetical protein